LNIELLFLIVVAMIAGAWSRIVHEAIVARKLTDSIVAREISYTVTATALFLVLVLGSEAHISLLALFMAFMAASHLTFWVEGQLAIQERNNKQTNN
jgi:hypothetical protein